MLGRDRPDAHGLRAGHPDRRHHREAAGLRLEFAGLSRNFARRNVAGRASCATAPGAAATYALAMEIVSIMTLPNEQDRPSTAGAARSDREDAGVDVGELQAALAAAEARALESRDLYMRALAEIGERPQARRPRCRAGAQVRARALRQRPGRREGQPGAGPRERRASAGRAARRNRSDAEAAEQGVREGRA